MACAAERLSEVGATGFFTFAASGGTGQSLSCAAVHPAKSKTTAAITNRPIPLPAPKFLRAIRSLRDWIRPAAGEYIFLNTIIVYTAYPKTRKIGFALCVMFPYLIG